MIKYIFSVCILTFMMSCENKNTSEKVEDTQKETVLVEDTNSSDVEGGKIEAPEKNATEVAMNSDAPEYMNLDLIGYDTPSINLNQHYGKVVFLNHWGSWCPPCRREMPSIQSLYDTYGDKVEFVMIATEKRPGAHVPYIQKEGFSFPVYSMNSPASTEIKAKGFPTTVILDKKGEIRTYDVGAKDWNSTAVHDFLDKLLAE